MSKGKAEIRPKEIESAARGLNDTKFISLLSSLDKDEMNEFTKFLDSPFCNRKGLYIVKAFAEIKKHHPDYNSADFTRKNIFAVLYPGKDYNDVLMRKILSELHKLGEDFLCAIETGKFDFHRELKLLSEFRKRKLNKLFEKKYSELAKYLNDPEGKLDENYFRNRNAVELEALKYELYMNRQHKASEIQSKVERNVIYDALINILDADYTSTALREVNFFSKKDLLGGVIKYFDFGELQKFLKKNTPGDYPVFELLYYRWLSHVEIDKDEHYFKLKELMFSRLNYFNHEEQYNMLKALQNSAIQKMRVGKREFNNELFSIFKLMLEKNLLISEEESYMRISTFRNVFLCAFIAGDYKWCEWFLERYKNTLAPDIKDSTYYLLHAELELINRNFDKALSDLQKVKYDHFMMKKEVQIMMLKIYYETASYEPALSLIDNLKHYYKDTKAVSSDFRETDEPFLKFLQQLILFRSGNNKINKDELLQKISQTNVIEKSWLIEKTKALN